jgi:RHS repeat-associated protein
VTLYDYCGCGSPSTITRLNGNSSLVTYFSYDMASKLTNVVYPDGYQLNYTYTSDDQVATVSDSGGRELELSYVQNGPGFLVSEADLNGFPLVKREFDEYGRVVSSLDRNGVTVTNIYDALGRLTARQSYGGSDQTGWENFAYDLRGLTNYLDALGNLTTFVRDEAGRVLYETNANNEVLRFTYNAADELLTLADGKNQITTWKYDTFGRVTNKLDATSTEIFRYQYDPLDRLTNRWSVVKGNTIYKYDPIGNLTNVVYPVSPSITLRYDLLNRLTNIVDGVGSTAFTWTDGDQLASEDGPWADDTVSYSYTDRLRSAFTVLQPNTSPWSQSYGYDAFSRLINVTSAAGSFGYEYPNGYNGPGASDRVLKLTMPGNDSNNGRDFYIANTYDGLARLTGTRLVTPLNPYSTPANVHQYSYDLSSQRTAMTNLSGDFRLYTYDKIGQLQTAKGYEADNTPRLQEQFGYAYDAAWNLSQRTNGYLVQTFNVNSLNELTTATRSGTFTVAGTATEPKGGYIYPPDYPPGVTNVTVSGTGLSSGKAELYLDGTWARTNATLANGNNSYSATAQDTYNRQHSGSVTVNLPATNTFVYDLNGNLRTNNTRIFDYDDENQLIRITEPGVWKSEFSYDGLARRRIRKEYMWQSSAWVQTNEVRYVCDGMLVIQERDANNLSQVTYTRGGDLSGSLQEAGGIGGLLARTDNGQSTGGIVSAHAFYHCDGNGNVTALANSNGVIVAHYEYDPYGNLLAITGPLAEANVYRFSSKEWHLNSGLIYYGFRFYSPSLQRWLNRDPAEEKNGCNLLGFVRNNPISLIDPFGLCTLQDMPPIKLSLHQPEMLGCLGSNSQDQSPIVQSLSLRLGSSSPNPDSHAQFPSPTPPYFPIVITKTPRPVDPPNNCIGKFIFKLISMAKNPPEPFDPASSPYISFGSITNTPYYSGAGQAPPRGGTCSVNYSFK